MQQNGDDSHTIIFLKSWLTLEMVCLPPERNQRSSKVFSFIVLFIVCVSVFAQCLTAHCGGQRTTANVGFLCPPCGSWVSNLGDEAWFTC